jgi:hypothetical protein
MNATKIRLVAFVFIKNDNSIRKRFNESVRK